MNVDAMLSRIEQVLLLELNAIYRLRRDRRKVTAAVRAGMGQRRRSSTPVVGERNDRLAARGEIRRELAASERRLGRAIQDVVATMFGPVHSSHPQFDSARDVLFTSMRGVALTYSFVERDPATDPHLALWRSLAHGLLDVDSSSKITSQP